jgi:uncharacterized membrane protein SirB2
MKHLTRIERIIPFLMDGLAALAGGVVATFVLGVLSVAVKEWTSAAVGVLLLAIVTAGAFLAVRIARKSIRDQVHMELAEGGK